MEPEVSQIGASESAAALRQRIEDVAGRYGPVPADSRVRDFWREISAIQQDIDSASTITRDDKQRLRREAAVLTRHVRNEQRKRNAEAKQLMNELLERIQLLDEERSHATSTTELQQVRSDLAAIRRRITESSSLDRSQHSEVWNAWQTCSQDTWNALNGLWTRNEKHLATSLDEAESSLARSDVKGARDRIRAFHKESTSHECSHAALRKLRLRANTVWQQAETVAQRKHETYMAQASARLERWKALLERQERARQSVQEDVCALERRAAEARTDVAAALLRGQLVDRRRVYSRLEAECADLRSRVESTELSLLNR